MLGIKIIMRMLKHYNEQMKFYGFKNYCISSYKKTWLVTNTRNSLYNYGRLVSSTVPWLELRHSLASWPASYYVVQEAKIFKIDVDVGLLSM